MLGDDVTCDAQGKARVTLNISVDCSSITRVNFYFPIAFGGDYIIISNNNFSRDFTSQINGDRVFYVNIDHFGTANSATVNFSYGESEVEKTPVNGQSWTFDNDGLSLDENYLLDGVVGTSPCFDSASIAEISSSKFWETPSNALFKITPVIQVVGSTLTLKEFIIEPLVQQAQE